MSDYLESNNEFWLMQDAILREKFNIKNGLRPKDMDVIKYKSKMKEKFKDIGALNSAWKTSFKDFSEISEKYSR